MYDVRLVKHIYDAFPMSGESVLVGDISLQAFIACIIVLKSSSTSLRETVLRGCNKRESSELWNLSFFFKFKGDKPSAALQTNSIAVLRSLCLQSSVSFWPFLWV